MPQPIHHHQNDKAAGEVVLGVDTHEETQRGLLRRLARRQPPGGILRQNPRHRLPAVVTDNRALPHRPVPTALGIDTRTRNDLARLITEGKTRREATRCA
jgi:hypothetical protein